MGEPISNSLNNLISDCCRAIPLLRQAFSSTVRKKRFDAILLSGGIDTSVIAALSAHWKPLAITIVYRGYGEDLPYAKKVANHFRLKHVIANFSLDEARKASEEVISVLKVFDPMEVRNSIPILIGLKVAKSEGVKSVATGDGGDELFGGYPWLFHLSQEQLHEWIKNVVKTWHFSSKPLGDYLNLEVLQPFTDPDIVEIASKISPSLKVVEINGKKIGKWILRKAFEDIVPKNVIWRNKSPIEVGSGSTKLSHDFAQLISGEEYNLLGEQVKLRSKEHAYYFKIYKRVVGEIPPPKAGEKKCPACGAGVPSCIKFCRICGKYPV